MNANDMITWSPGVSLEEIERQVILKAFNHFNKNKTATAQSLGIAIRTLDNKLEKYEADGKREDAANVAYREERVKFLARQRGNVQTNPQTGNDLLGPIAGFHMEPSPEAAAQSDMPVPKRDQVQKVLPTRDAKGSQQKTR